MSRATGGATARAKSRGGDEVTPDDLLASALAQVARFGIAPVGSWAIDVTVLDGGGVAVEAEGGARGDRTLELLSVDRAASFLHVHAQTVRNYIRASKLPAYRLAGERFVRVLRRDIVGLLEPVDVDDTGEPDTELEFHTFDAGDGRCLDSRWSGSCPGSPRKT